MRLSPFKAVLAVVVIATIYVLFSRHASAPGTDTSKLHLSGATTIVQSGDYRITQRTPLYPLLLAGIAVVTKTPAAPSVPKAREMGNREWMQVSEAFLGTGFLSAVLWFQYVFWLLTFACIVSMAKLAGVTIGWQFLLFSVPSSWLMVVSVHDLIIAHAILVVGSLFFVLAYTQPGKDVYFLTAGFCFALAGLSRPTYQLLSLFLVAALYYPIQRQLGTKWADRFMLYTVVAWLIVVGGYSVYNLQKNDIYGVSSALGIALSTKTPLFIDRTAEEYPEEVPVFLKIRDELILHSQTRSGALWGDQASLWLMDTKGMTYAEASRFLTTFNLVAISKAPLHYSWEVATSMVAFLFPNAPDWPLLPRLVAAIAEAGVVMLFVCCVALWIVVHVLRRKSLGGIGEWTKLDTIQLLLVSLFAYTIVVSSCADLGRAHNRIPVQFVMPLTIGFTMKRLAKK